MADQFTFESYQRIAQSCKTGRHACAYSDTADCVPHSFFWRHDVDFCLRKAVDIAEIDSQLGLQASFFVNPHSDSYNISSSLGREQLLRIQELGHAIELHLDVEFHGVLQTPGSLATAVSEDATIIERVCGIRPRAFSFHNPTEADLRHDAFSYAGLINCYSAQFRTDIAYVSDSNGFWRFKDISETLAGNPERPIQILTHPEWWSDVNLEPRERLAACLFNNVFETMSRYDRALHAHSRENRSGLNLEQSSESPLELGIQTFSSIFFED